MRWLLLACALVGCRYHFDELTDAGDVANAGPAIAVRAGGSFACALHDSGKVSCWGRNEDGELGDGTLTARSTPALVPGITDAVEITLGDTHACARRSAGEIVCWGQNEF